MNRKKFVSAVWSVLIVLRLLLFFFEKKYCYRLIYDDIYVFINCTIILLTLFLCISFQKNENKIKSLQKIIITIYIAFLIIYFIINHYIGGVIVGPTSRYFFSSPDGKNTLLLEEEENITGCTIDGYKIIWLVFKVDIWPKYDTRVGFSEPDTPIKKGNYKILWKDNSEVCVIVYSDSQEETIKVNFK